MKLYPRNNNILYIGDSHSVTTVGQVLLRFFTHESSIDDAYLFYYGISGSCFTDWFNSNLSHFQIKNLTKLPKQEISITAEPIHLNFEFMLEQVNPRTIIFSLGTNDMVYHYENFGQQLNKIEEGFQRLHEKYPEIKLIWLMPPEFSRDLEISSLRSEFKNRLEKNLFLNIINVTGFIPDQEDKVHFNKEMALKYAEALVAMLKKIKF